LLIAGLLALATGAALLARSVGDYLGHPVAVSSTSGVWVFRLADGSLGGFERYTLGVEPLVIGVGLLLVVAAALVGAVTHRR
jgi:hypothetical protein